MYDILVKYSSTLFFGPYILRNVNGHNAADNDIVILNIVKCVYV